MKTKVEEKLSDKNSDEQLLESHCKLITVKNTDHSVD